MKKTIITLASVAALAGAADAQTYHAGQHVKFNSLSDMVAGSGTVLDTGFTIADGIDRDGGSVSGDSNWWYLAKDTGVLGTPLGSLSVTWLAGNVSDYWYAEEDSSHRVVFHTDVATFHAGELVSFASNTSLASASGTVIQSGVDISFNIDRDGGLTSGDSNWRWLKKDTGEYAAPGETGTAAWLAGSVSDFWYAEEDSSYRVVFNSTVSVPEPSSTALLGLGGFGLLARRKRS